MARLLYRWDGWTFEPAEYRLLNPASEPIPLANKTLDVLALLVERAPALVTKEELLSRLWSDAIVEEGNIAFHVAALRRTLDHAGGTSCIENIRGRGYRFVAAVTPVEPGKMRGSADEGFYEPQFAGAPERSRVWVFAAVALIAIVAVAIWWSKLLPASVKAAPVPSTAAALVAEGRNLWRLRTPDDVRRAIRVLERATAADENYAPAYAALADAYNITMSGLPPSARYERAKAYAERAVALQPDLAEGHTSLGFLRYKFEWRWDDAEKEFEKAIALNANYALAHHWYGEMLGLLGRYDESIRELHTALALEPDSLAIQSDLVAPLLGAGRIAEARQVIETAAKASPAWHWIPFRMSEVLAAEGRERESLEEHWRWMLLSGATFNSVDAQRTAYRAGGMHAVIRVEIAQLLEAEKANPGGWMIASKLSRAYARLGERRESLRWISTALDRREDVAVMLLTSRDYDTLRDDPEFAPLLARTGLKPLPLK